LANALYDQNIETPIRTDETINAKKVNGVFSTGQKDLLKIETIRSNNCFVALMQIRKKHKIDINDVAILAAMKDVVGSMYPPCATQ